VEARDRQTDGQTDRQDQHMMGPSSRKDGPIITYGSNGQTDGQDLITGRVTLIHPAS